jgi:hypothetical protein
LSNAADTAIFLLRAPGKLSGQAFCAVPLPGQALRPPGHARVAKGGFLFVLGETAGAYFTGRNIDAAAAVVIDCLLVLVKAALALDAFGFVDRLVRGGFEDVVRHARESADGAFDAVPGAWVGEVSWLAGQAVAFVVVLARLGTLVVGDECVGGAQFAAVGFRVADFVLVLSKKAGLALFHDADENHPRGGAVFAVVKAVVFVVVVARV